MSLRVGVIQSAYAPWRGYFDLMSSVDVFIQYDDVQYSKNSWRNRNRLKMADGLTWITVPVRASLSQTIDGVDVDGAAWVEKHERLLKLALGPAPYFDETLGLWKDAIGAAVTGQKSVRLSELNRKLTMAICGFLGINTPVESSRVFAPQGRSTDRLVDLLTKVGATTYVSGPSGRDYIDPSLFAQAGIRLEYKTYDYAPYRQLWGGFEGRVAVLDLIANEGPAARNHLKSLTPNVVADVS